MTNADLQSMIDLYGDRIFCINLNNMRCIYIGYKDGISLSDITLETVGTTDMIVVSTKDPNPSNTVTYKVYHLTKEIQWIGVMDEGSSKYRVDPLLLR